MKTELFLFVGALAIAGLVFWVPLILFLARYKKHEKRLGEIEQLLVDCKNILRS